MERWIRATQQEKLEILALYGDSILEYKRDGVVVELFVLNNMYVEVLMNPDDRKVVGILASKMMVEDDACLNAIDVSELIDCLYP